MTRRRLPAFGARLRDRRRRGELPLCVHLIYGYDWRAQTKCGWGFLPSKPHPELALKPNDYMPGVFDFSVVMGLQVCVFDQVGEAAFYDDAEAGPARPALTRIWHLMGELAPFAEVQLHSPAAFGATQWFAFELAHMERRQRLRAGITSNNAWPFWWSDDIEEKNAKRRQAWCRIALDPAALQCA